MKIIELPEESQWFPLRGNPGWTAHAEVKWLRWLAGQTSGGILEIGCNSGQVTYELAAEYPKRPVVGVDWVPSGGRDGLDGRSGLDGQRADGVTMCPEQRGEMPSNGEAVGMAARGLANVVILNVNSRNLDMAVLSRWVDSPIDFIFIDGDHSYDGVKTDTELALRYLGRGDSPRRRGERGEGERINNNHTPEQSDDMPLRGTGTEGTEGKGRGIIAWHDCSEDHPGWVGVLRYLKELDAERVAAGLSEVVRVKGTWMAFLEV